MYSRRDDGGIPRYAIRREQVDAEQQRLEQALSTACQELAELRERMLRELGKAEADIFATHLALLRDRQFIQNVRERIARDRVNVEQALDAEIADLARLLEDMENEFFQDRAHDVHDVGRRLLRHLGHVPRDELNSLPPKTVVLARQLAPSDTLNLDRRNVVAIVTERGGSTSHTAILARSLGIPAVSNIESAAAIHTGEVVLVDGNNGHVHVATNEQESAITLEQWVRQHQGQAEPTDQETPCRTADGKEIHLYANIDRPEEARNVEPKGLEGVGLFRTEYLFLRTDDPPSAASQREVYGRLVELMVDKPVVVRTLDLGGDKMPLFRLSNAAGANYRGLRFSLLESHLLRDQLQAILQAMGESKVAILFPMVLGGADIRQAVEQVDQLRAEMGLEKRPCLGAMIETPSALFELSEILDVVDFVSIGTNDLVQFMLAVDRMAADALGEEALFQPAILRAIERVIVAAERRQKPVCLCGEAASRPDIACLLVGLGVRNLSMAPSRAVAVRREIRRHRLEDLKDLARRALACRQAEEVARLLGETLAASTVEV